MAEPRKKPGKQPESYQPKKPEMMRALEEAQERAALDKTHMVKSEGGGVRTC